MHRAEVVHHRCKMQVICELSRASVGKRESRKVENRLVQIAEEPLFHLCFATNFANRIDGENLSVEGFAFVEGLHVRMYQLESAVRTDNARYKPTCAGLDAIRDKACASEEQKRNLGGSICEDRHKTRHASFDNPSPRDNSDQDNAVAVVAVRNFRNFSLVEIRARNVV